MNTKNAFQTTDPYNKLSYQLIEDEEKFVESYFQNEDDAFINKVMGNIKKESSPLEPTTSISEVVNKLNKKKPTKDFDYRGKAL